MKKLKKILEKILVILICIMIFVVILSILTFPIILSVILNNYWLLLLYIIWWLPATVLIGIFVQILIYIDNLKSRL